MNLATWFYQQKLRKHGVATYAVLYQKGWRFGAVGSDIGQNNEVTLRRARLVLGWVTVSGFNSWCGKFISV